MRSSYLHVHVCGYMYTYLSAISYYFIPISYYFIPPDKRKAFTPSHKSPFTNSNFISHHAANVIFMTTLCLSNAFGCIGQPRQKAVESKRCNPHTYSHNPSHPILAIASTRLGRSFCCCTFLLLNTPKPNPDVVLCAHRVCIWSITKISLHIQCAQVLQCGANACFQAKNDVTKGHLLQQIFPNRLMR